MGQLFKFAILGLALLMGCDAFNQTAQAGQRSLRIEHHRRGGLLQRLRERRAERLQDRAERLQDRQDHRQREFRLEIHRGRDARGLRDHRRRNLSGHHAERVREFRDDTHGGYHVERQIIRERYRHDAEDLDAECLEGDCYQGREELRARIDDGHNCRSFFRSH